MPQWDRFQAFLESDFYKGLRNPVIFKTTRPIRFNESGMVEPYPEEWIPYTATIGGEHGSETWTYSPTQPRKIKDELKFSQRGRIMKNAWVLDKNKDKDFIFFFCEISPFVKKKRIVLEDKRVEARKSIDKVLSDTEVRFMIYSDYSPISVKSTGSEDTLRMLAAAWGVTNAHSKEYSIDEIKVALAGQVEKGQANYNSTNRGFKEFLEEAQASELYELRANIQKAIDFGILLYDAENFEWRLAHAKSPLCSLTSEDIDAPANGLYKFLKTRSDKVDIIINLLGRRAYGRSAESIVEIDNPAEDEEERFSDNEITHQKKLINFDTMEYKDIQSMAAEMGIKSFGVKKNVLVLKIKEKLGQE